MLVQGQELKFVLMPKNFLISWKETLIRKAIFIITITITMLILVISIRIE